MHGCRIDYKSWTNFHPTILTGGFNESPKHRTTNRTNHASGHRTPSPCPRSDAGAQGAQNLKLGTMPGLSGTGHGAGSAGDECSERGAGACNRSGEGSGAAPFLNACRTAGRRGQQCGSSEPKSA